MTFVKCKTGIVSSSQASVLLVLACIFISPDVYSQFARDNKWPYLGNKIPRFIGFTIGAENLESTFVTGGIGANVIPTKIKRRIGGYIGFDARYKLNLTDNTLKGYEINIGVFSGICFGLNLNYNHKEDYSTMGFKPFVGIGAYYFFATYGYNVFSKSNEIEELSHHTFTLHCMIPVYGFVYKGPKVSKGVSKRKLDKIIKLNF